MAGGSFETGHPESFGGRRYDPAVSLLIEKWDFSLCRLQVILKPWWRIVFL
jgi:hypothetical protein